MLTQRHPAQRDVDGWIAQAIAAQPQPDRKALTVADFALLAQLAQETALAMHLAIVVSLVDAHGHPRYFVSMDNALLVSHRLAGQKAYSAVALRMPTHELAEQVQPGAPLFGLQQQADICAVGGGLPCWHQGHLLGGIGISGGTAEEDVAIARHVLHHFTQQRFSLSPFA